jgi:ankyrin repeat protein
MPGKKSSKKAKAKANTALVPHRAPQLSTLLERAKGGKRSDVQQYLSAGGSPNVLVDISIGSKVTLLFSVAIQGHSEAADSIKLLLQAGADTTQLCEAPECDEGTRFCTALMGALAQPVTQGALQALLDGGADPCYQTGDTGTSALHVAAMSGALQHCEVLVAASAGRALHLTMCGGNTPLLAASCAHESAAVKMLCSLGSDVNSSDSCGTTALMLAANDGDVALLQFLLQQKGIKVNHSSNDGRTAVLIAAAAGASDAVTLLLEHGADALAKNSRGENALFAAVGNGHLHIVQLLLQRGLDINSTEQSGRTLLMHINTAGAEHLAEFLLQQGLSVHTLDAGQSTALHYAAHNSTPDTLQLLLAHGADVNAVASDGATSLHSAAFAGQLQNAEVLLAAGTDVNVSTDKGATALHYAVEEKHAAVVRLLLEHGATALVNTLQLRMCSCCGLMSTLMRCNDVAVMKLLMTAGASAQAVTSRGNTSLHVVAQHGYTAPVVCLLIKAGADLHAVNSEGKTAAQVAHDAGHTLIEQLLNRAAHR